MGNARLQGQQSQERDGRGYGYLWGAPGGLSPAVLAAEARHSGRLRGAIGTHTIRRR